MELTVFNTTNSINLPNPMFQNTYMVPPRIYLPASRVRRDTDDAHMHHQMSGHSHSHSNHNHGKSAHNHDNSSHNHGSSSHNHGKSVNKDMSSSDGDDSSEGSGDVLHHDKKHNHGSSHHQHGTSDEEEDYMEGSGDSEHMHAEHEKKSMINEGSGTFFDDTEEDDLGNDRDITFDEDIQSHQEEVSILDDPSRAPFDIDHVMTSILPLNMSSFNVTGNFTEEPRARWKEILDNVVKYIMMFNVVGLMLGMGCAIYWREIVGNLWPPIGICIGMVGQFLVLPATGFGFSVLFKLKPYEALGCLIVSCSPGGSFSNFFTYWVDGDLALSIVMTSFSSIIAFGGMPFNLWLYSSHWVGDEGGDLVIPFTSIIRSLAFICGPVIVGMIIRHFSERIAKGITRVTSIVGYVGFLTVLTSWAILYWRVFHEATSLIYASAVILPVTGFTLAYLIAFIFRRPHKVCRTIGIETGSQNMPVALSIILLSFDDPKVRAQMLLFPTLYGIFMLCEVFLGIGVYTLVTQCMKRNKKGDKTKTIENGGDEEMQTLKGRDKK